MCVSVSLRLRVCLSMCVRVCLRVSVVIASVIVSVFVFISIDSFHTFAIHDASNPRDVKCWRPRDVSARIAQQNTFSFDVSSLPNGTRKFDVLTSAAELDDY